MILSDFLQYGAHFRKFSAKSNEGNLKYNRKGPFLGYFGPFLPNLGKMRIFPKNRALSLLSLYESLTSCKRPEKTNEPIPRKVRYGRTHRRTLSGSKRRGSKKKEQQQACYTGPPPKMKIFLDTEWFHLITNQ